MIDRNVSLHSRFSTSSTGKKPKIVFIIGRNASAHYMLRESITSLANFGIPCDVWLTDTLPNETLKRKLAVPEVQNLRFYETLMINHGYSVLEHYGIPVQEGELISSQMYTPRQLANHYSARGTPIRVRNMLDINCEAFVKLINEDDQIALGYNIRGMQILKRPLIDAFESKIYRGNKGRIANVHPADVFSYPGTNTAFWCRINGSVENVVTIHVIDENIDTGPFLDRTSAPLKPGKTLLQDMLSMRYPAAAMIANDATMFLSGSPRVPTPQQKMGHEKKLTNYSHATHEEWLEGHKLGIRVADTEGFLNALVADYTGPRSVKVGKDLKYSLAVALEEWQREYLDMYRNAYDSIPPEMSDNPKQYQVVLPEPPPNGLVNGSNPTSLGETNGNESVGGSGASANITALDPIDAFYNNAANDHNREDHLSELRAQLGFSSGPSI